MSRDSVSPFSRHSTLRTLDKVDDLTLLVLTQRADGAVVTFDFEFFKDYMVRLFILLGEA